MKSKLRLFVLFVIVLTGLNNITAQDFKEFRKSFNINKNGEVILDTYKGEVTIEPSGSDVVEVYARIEPDRGGFLSTSEKKQLENATVLFDASSNSVRIKSEYKHNSSWFGSNTMALVFYTIKMPKTASLKVKDYKSDSDISGLESPIEFETYKGRVKVRNLNGSIDLETYKGEVNVRFVNLTGNSKFDTYKGDISVTLPKNSAFSFDTDFGKRVDFENDFNLSRKSSGRKSKNYNYSGDVNGGGQKIKMSSDKGNLRLLAN